MKVKENASQEPRANEAKECDSVYAQVKYLRKSVNDVNKMVDYNNQTPPNSHKWHCLEPRPHPCCDKCPSTEGDRKISGSNAR